MLLIALLVWVANVALWVDRNVVDQEAFTATVSEVLLEEESRAVIAVEVVDAAVDGLPLLVLVRSPLESLFESMLASEVMQSTVAFTAAEVYAIVVEGRISPLVIGLLAVEDAVLGLLGEFAPSAVDLLPDGFFEAFEVLEEGQLPSYSGLAATVPWLWPLATALAVLLAAVLIGLSPNRAVSVFAVGIAIVVAALLSFLADLVVEPSILERLGGEVLEVLGELAYEAFSASYVLQTFALLGFGVVVAVGGAVWLGAEWSSRTVPHEA